MQVEQPHEPFWRRAFTPRGELTASLFAGGLLLAGFVLETVLKADWFGANWGGPLIWASLAIGMVYGGRPALHALREVRFDIDVLMVVGAALAAYIGHPAEGALLLFLFTLSGALEDLAMLRTQREIEELHKLMPVDALVLRGGEWVEAPAESLAPGDRIKIRPGERAPADATVATGETSMDQSAITGESLPRDVKPGDELFAGTINTDDPIEAVVLRSVRESSLQKILDLVTKAREQREPVQRFIDRLSQPYAIGVLVLSTAVLLFWWLVLDRPLLGNGLEKGALYTAITLLIVASPCAVVIATPTATLAGIARAARGGVLFKGGQSVEQLARIASVCFDKTGTLTFGRPRLYEVHPVAWSDGKELLALAAGLEEDSTHPIAQAVREAAQQRGLTPMAIEGVNHVTARGIEGMFRGRRVRLGRYSFCEPLIPVCFRNRVQEVLKRIQDRGHVAVTVVREGVEHSGNGDVECVQSPESGEAAVLIMADAVRPGATELTRELHTMDIKPVRMLTGDNTLTAQRIATSLSLDGFDAELLPEEKLEILSQMRREAHAAGRGGVAMIGDGVNDAPALAAADVAVAIGTIGTAAALESADVVLLSDNLATVPWAVRLARRIRRTISVNLTIALSIIVLMGIFTLVSSLRHTPVPLSVGVLAHEGGTVLVVLNSLLLLTIAGPRGVQGESQTRGTTKARRAAPADDAVVGSLTS